MFTLDIITPAGTVGMPTTYGNTDEAVRAFLDTVPLDGGAERVCPILTNTVLRVSHQGRTAALGLFEPSPSGGKWPVCAVTSNGAWSTYVATLFGWEVH